jgi:hypothetical protein
MKNKNLIYLLLAGLGIYLVTKKKSEETPSSNTPSDADANTFPGSNSTADKTIPQNTGVVPPSTF